MNQTVCKLFEAVIIALEDLSGFGSCQSCSAACGKGLDALLPGHTGRHHCPVNDVVEVLQENQAVRCGNHNRELASRRWAYAASAVCSSIMKQTQQAKARSSTRGTSAALIYLRITTSADAHCHRAILITGSSRQQGFCSKNSMHMQCRTYALHLYMQRARDGIRSVSECKCMQQLACSNACALCTPCRGS
jgi:hypothetical protein